MKLSEMRQILGERQILLTKSLGQNFLHDGNQLRRMVALAELKPTDRVLEIGPGLGPLTELLLGNAAAVLAIEKDARLVAVLRERLGHEPKLTLLHADALDYLQDHPADWSGWKVVANLPYSVASALLVELALGATCPARLVVTLQLEVGQRLAAPHHTRDYGVLTLLVQQRYQVSASLLIPAACFFPAPDIQSACVVLQERAGGLRSAPERSTFVRVVRRAFSERRKMMLKLLRRDWPEAALTGAFAALGIPVSSRAEAVTRSQFEALSQWLHPFETASTDLPTNHHPPLRQ